jgi:hypothetical protein
MDLGNGTLNNGEKIGSIVSNKLKNMGEKGKCL